MTTPDLPALVADLSELYQPVYGHPEFDPGVARPTEDRLALAIPAIRCLAQRLGRPVRVLDLGCAQGYFSLSLAATGAIVTGLDMQAADIALCRHLADEHPDYDVTFIHAKAEDALEGLGEDAFDVILAFNVLHHVAYEHDAARVVKLMRHAAGRTHLVLAEIALRTEPLYWAAAQPADPRDLLAGFAFVHCIGQAATHLSSQSRPIYVASSKWCYLGGTLLRIDDWMARSHELAGNFHAGSRRYFECEARLVKYFLFDAAPALSDANRRELAQEAAFLATPPAGLGRTPELFGYDADDRAGWLVRAWVPGRRLSAFLAEGTVFDRTIVLDDVLESLCALESAGLYHADLRLWNVIVNDEGRASIIDYGDISGSPQCKWPGDVFLSFIIFVRELAGTDLPRIVPTREPTFAPEHFTGIYREFVSQIWSVPEESWTFARFRAIWRSLNGRPGITIEPRPQDHQAVHASWQGAIEQQLVALGGYQLSMQHLLVSAIARQREDQAWLRHEVQAAHDQRVALGGELASVRVRMDAAEAIVRSASDTFTWQAEREASRLQLTDLQTAVASARQRLAVEVASLETTRAECEELRAEMTKARETAHHWWSVSVQWQEQYRAIEKSSSWRITAPIRSMGRLVRALAGLPSTSVSAGRRAARKIAVGMAAAVLKRPRLRYRVGSLVQRHPVLRDRLRRFGRDAGLLPTLQSPSTGSAIAGVSSEEVATLSAHGRAILADLRFQARRARKEP